MHTYVAIYAAIRGEVIMLINLSIILHSHNYAYASVSLVSLIQHLIISIIWHIGITPNSDHYLVGVESFISDVTSTEEYNFLYCTLR